MASEIQSMLECSTSFRDKMQFIVMLFASFMIFRCQNVHFVEIEVISSESFLVVIYIL